jgi:cellulose synthase/poly-beta-1,6-N-acetylglucosamine synthase-like glycosyltransferase
MLTVVMIAIFCLPAFFVFVWFVEVLAGCAALRKQRNSPRTAFDMTPRPKTAVLVPAHNEGTGILPTIRDAQAQLGPDDRILVVADNCTDDTAAVARAAGAEVVVRTDPARRGKGFALSFGVKHLERDAPDIVIILDADCRLGDDVLPHLAQAAVTSGRPVQALYLMLAPEDAPNSKRVSLFAWRVRNWLRPLGMQLFGLPTQLFGTGMAFPFRLLKGRDLGNSRLAEDTALGLALASSGYPPLFASEARIYSRFPVSQASTERQRQRWEKGQLDNVVELVPKAIATSFRTASLALAALAIDMAVPPLSLLVLVTAFCLGLGTAAWLLGAWAAVLAMPALTALLLVLGVAAAWIAVGREVLPFRELARLPLHIGEKLGLYRSIALGRATSSWIRTDRK